MSSLRIYHSKKTRSRGTHVPIEDTHKRNDKIIRVPCSWCGEMFDKNKCHYTYTLNHNQKVYCSNDCVKKSRRKPKPHKRRVNNKAGPENLQMLLTTFLALEEHGSFTATARALYLSNETATMYRLTALENYLGVKLFTRLRGGGSKRRLILTSVGQHLYNKLRAGEWHGEHVQENGLANYSEV